MPPGRVNWVNVWNASWSGQLVQCLECLLVGSIRSMFGMLPGRVNWVNAWNASWSGQLGQCLECLLVGLIGSIFGMPPGRVGVLGWLLVVVLWGGSLGSVPSVGCCVRHCTEALVYSDHPRAAAASSYLATIFGRIASGVPWFLRSTAEPMQHPHQCWRWCRPW